MRMMKVRVATTFATAQAVSAKQHASRRSANTEVEDRAALHGLTFARENTIRLSCVTRVRQQWRQGLPRLG